MQDGAGVHKHIQHTREPTNGALDKHFQINAKGCQSFYLGHELQILIQVFAEILALYLAPPIHPLPTRLKQWQPAPSPSGFLLDTSETWPCAREDFSPEPPHGYFGDGKVTMETKNQGGTHTGL